MLSCEPVLIHHQNTKFWGSNDRGVSFRFGDEVVTSFLQQNDFDPIYRAHQVLDILISEMVTTCSISGIPYFIVASVYNGSISDFYGL
jgi:hypothetical protein